ncbi:hypothetical protein [Lentzea tibetensis]|uniref:hypothetical protein n=1 Tax=Lentzea tibetensis TaxID=2591470 RepID=UPI0011B74148|nr:hypothetical protein [Lentzea tibetensis]
MAQQHDPPPAFLRMWWHIPNWSRMLPAVVVGGGALASMALVSTSMPPSPDTPDMAAPATPGLMVQAPFDSRDMTAVDYVHTSGTTASSAKTTAKLVSSATTATVAQSETQQQAGPQPLQQVQLDQLQPRGGDIDSSVQTASPADSGGGADTAGVQLPPANLSGANLTGVREAARAELTGINVPGADGTRLVSHFVSN